MPITQLESGLTLTDYNNLNAANKSAVYQVIAHKWIPEFSPEHITTVTQIADDFASVLHDDTIYRIAHNIVEYLNTTWQVVSGFTLPTGFISVPYSLISNTNLYVYALTSTGIQVNSYDGSAWSGWSTIITDSTINLFAAVSTTCIHYIIRDNTNNRYNLKVAQWDGSSWVITTSDIYWPYPIFSFDAKTLNGKDILVLSTEVPGNISAKFVNNQVVKYTLRAGGIIGFTFQYNSWSNHFEIDVLDQLTQFVYRNNVRLSLVNNKLWLTSYSSIGDEVSAPEYYRSYTSKDGTHWSRGEYFSINATEKNGFNLLPLGDYLYGVFRTTIHKATSTLMFDYSPSSQQLDVSDEVLSLNINRQDMQQITIKLDTSTGWNVGSILDGSKIVILEVNLGYWVSTSQKLMKVGTFEIDSITPSEDLPNTQIDISGRDFLAWMSTKNQAETFKYWQPQIAYGDQYVDTTGTGYGGLGNTATQVGSWRTVDGSLQLIDNNSEGIVFNTLISEDTWNATIESQENLSSLSNNEYMGLLFRAQDKDNAFFYYYNQSDDKLYLTQRAAGVSTTLWSSSAKSWSGSLTQRWLKVDYYYCSIHLYSSTDGITWILEQTVLVTGKPLGTQITPDGLIRDDTAFPQSGFTGLIAKGYSDQGYWSADPGPIQIANSPTDVFYYYKLPQVLSTPLKFWAVGCRLSHTGSTTITGDGRAYRLQLDETGSGTWEEYGSASGLPSAPLQKNFKGQSNPFDRDTKFMLFGTGIYKGKIWDVSPTFSLVANPFDVWPSIGTQLYFSDFMMSVFKKDYIIAVGYLTNPGSHIGSGALVGWSEDLGVTWTWTTIYFLSEYGRFFRIGMSGWDGTIYLLFYRNIAGYTVSSIVKSSDWGKTWQLTYLYQYYDGHLPTNALGMIGEINVPYRKQDGTPNYNGDFIYAMSVKDNSDNNQNKLYKSDDGGQTWTYIADFPLVYNSPGFGGGYENYNLYVHPSNSLYLAYMSGNTIVYSNDGGLTWSQIAGSANLQMVNGWPYSTDFLAAVGFNYNYSSPAQNIEYTPDKSSIVRLINPPNTNIGAIIPDEMGFIEADL